MEFFSTVAFPMRILIELVVVKMFKGNQLVEILVFRMASKELKIVNSRD